MTYYAFASEIPGFTPSDSGVVDQSNSDGFGRGRLLAGGVAGYGLIEDLPNLDDFWIHMSWVATYGPSVAQPLVVFIDSTDAEVGRLVFTGNVGGTSTLQFQENIATVWTNHGAAVTFNGAVVNVVDLRYLADASGELAIYLSGTERMTFTGDTSGMGDIVETRFYGFDTSFGSYFRQVAISSESTIGGRLFTYYPSGAGANGDWTGDYTSVDEIPYSDADFIFSDTNGQVEEFTITGPALTGYVVRAVGVYARAKRGSTGPANLQLVVRTSGADHVSSSYALSVGYKSIGNIWSQDPGTVADWLNTTIATMQIGVKAIT